MREQSARISGLYRPGEFKDNCGFGLIAHMEGQASHKLLQTSIEALTCMTHRGGIAADGKTGDGCGLLMQTPATFFKQVGEELFGEFGDSFAVGMVFLSQDDAAADHSREILAAQVQQRGLKVLGWRTVPVDTSVCGPIALDSLPKIEQIFIESDGLESADFNRELFYARRKAEKQLEQDEDFYVASLSATVISYKGLVMPADLANFYQDLSDKALATAIVVFHQRFSTNTLPKWPLAQPFRYLAHNGEINTIWGNRNWSVARTKKFETDKLADIDSILPLVNRTGSDSSSMDNMLETLLVGDMGLLRAVRMMVPPAWQNVETMDPDLRAFYEYNSMHMEPWDGPAGIVLTEGRYAMCLLDRNGLRPARWVVTKDGLITLASEIGVYDYRPEDVVAKGRVGPGQILVVDTQTGKLMHTDDVDQHLKERQPYRQWLKTKSIRLEASLSEKPCQHQVIEGASLKVYQKLFQVSYEERQQVLLPLGETGQEATGSMGDDTPMAVLSKHVRSLYDYFRQQFAQVTNPPIDPLREAIVMSLETCLGRERNVFEETAAHAERVILTSPVLSHEKYASLMGLKDKGFDQRVIDLNYDPETGLQQAILEVCQQAEQAVNDGIVILVLSDRNIEKGKLPIPAAMAAGAVHHRLIAQGLRCDANIVVASATVRDSHHFAVLLGFGVTAIYPYLAYDVLTDLVRNGEIIGDPDDVAKSYRRGIKKGLLKIMSKMGISTVASYRGAQLFEAIGVHDEVIDLCFKDLTSRIQGAGFDDFQDDSQKLAKKAWRVSESIDQGGLLKYVHGKEYHAFNPDVVYALHRAVENGDRAAYREYVSLVENRPVAAIRDLFKLRPKNKPIALSEVEAITEILPRFDSAGMSLGALSPEAHEAIATAMNRLGGRSNSGEGGEDEARFGTEKMSKIKQVASGRFGVTPHYLVNAEVLQIKVAQGAKPGEGGQLPGGKVNKLIARLRYSVPGVTLISPPPHHDIYSIEDLAQLIYDLKQVNPDALVSVKLVSEPGVGTVAAGVAKAYADLITISGYDGGTAASPLTSIRYAGSPWELGLSEAQQALRDNDLRDKVRLQTDGGLKGGLDVIKAAILGAESFGFGTIPMLALGCKYLRICHLNNCATGVATQNDELREEHFVGGPEMVMNYFRLVAEETREYMAQLGVRSMNELIGQTDLLEILPGETSKTQHLDLRPLLINDAVAEDKPNYCGVDRNVPFDKGEMAERMVQQLLPSIEAKSGGDFEMTITNCDRSIGARVSGEIAKRYGNHGMAEQAIRIRFKGTAGQSFGVWNAGGLEMYLEGDANDYVGKGMAGGKLVIRPPVESEFESRHTTIIGNTCLYGATNGKLFASGGAGERFAVRNSGAHAVVESAGDHCCEYMTGGCITVLGNTGYNFGAGMTGGFAYVLDLENLFYDRCNPELVDLHRVNGETMEAYRSHLRAVISEFVEETKSAWGAEILEDFDGYLRKFWLIKPKAASLERLLKDTRTRSE